MSIVRNNTVVMWKDFPFPMSIESFRIKEDAKVATYTYAGRNGAEHERVLNYRVFTLTGTFTSDSGEETPSFYANKLRALNNNQPGVLMHPVFGTYKCIIKNIDIEENGSELESTPVITPSGSYPKSAGTSITDVAKLSAATKQQSGKVSYSQRAIANYKFSIEFWEHIPPNAASLQASLNKLFPATTVKPTSDNYQTSTKYSTVDALYWALVNKQIEPGTDPIRNAAWLAYDYAFRKEAYDMWTADPTGATHTSTDNTVKISTTKTQNVYVVIVGDTAMKIAKKVNTTPDALFQANVGKKVRTTSKGTDGLYWKRISVIYPGDTLIIP